MKVTQLLLFWCLWYAAFATRSLISPFLPIIEDSFAINHATAGGLLFFTATGGTLALGLSSWLSARVGYKRLIICGFLLAAAALAGLRYAGTYSTFAVCLFFFGMGGGFYMPCAIPILTAVFSQQHWGKAISIHETAAGFSMVSIPFLVALALGIMPWRSIFLLLAAAVTVLALVFWVFGPDTQPRRRSGFGLATLLGRSDFWVILALWIASGIGVMGVYNIVPLFLVDEKGMTVEAANHLLSLSRIGGWTGQIALGFVLDRLRAKHIIGLSTLASGVMALGLAVVQPTWLLAVMLVLQGTFCVVFFPAGLMAISKLTQPEERPLFTGSIMAISGVISMGMAPGLLGAVADAYNFQIGLSLIGLGTLAVCPLVLALRDI